MDKKFGYFSAVMGEIIFPYVKADPFLRRLARYSALIQTQDEEELHALWNVGISFILHLRFLGMHVERISDTPLHRKLLQKLGIPKKLWLKNKAGQFEIALDNEYVIDVFRKYVPLFLKLQKTLGDEFKKQGIKLEFEVFNKNEIFAWGLLTLADLYVHLPSAFYNRKERNVAVAGQGFGNYAERRWNLRGFYRRYLKLARGGGFFTRENGRLQSFARLNQAAVKEVIYRLLGGLYDANGQKLKHDDILQMLRHANQVVSVAGRRSNGVFDFELRNNYSSSGANDVSEKKFEPNLYFYAAHFSLRQNDHARANVPTSQREKVEIYGRGSSLYSLPWLIQTLERRSMRSEFRSKDSPPQPRRLTSTGEPTRLGRARSEVREGITASPQAGVRFGQVDWNAVIQTSIGSQLVGVTTTEAVVAHKRRRSGSRPLPERGGCT